MSAIIPKGPYTKVELTSVHGRRDTESFGRLLSCLR